MPVRSCLLLALALQALPAVSQPVEAGAGDPHFRTGVVVVGEGVEVEQAVINGPVVGGAGAGDPHFRTEVVGVGEGVEVEQAVINGPAVGGAGGRDPHFRTGVVRVGAGVDVEQAVINGPVTDDADVGSSDFTVRVITIAEGVQVEQAVINGPPSPPAGFQPAQTRISMPGRSSAAAGRILAVPALRWFFGCSATSGAMVAGYYDRNGYGDMYAGAANGGVMPLDDSAWPTWTDSCGWTYARCPLTASQIGLDGRATRGSIGDYWICYGSTAVDPYITNGWLEHAWGSAIGDYMKTSQSAFGNTDGSTTFYAYIHVPDRLTCDSMESYGISDLDGTYGRKLFYEARGYAVTDCYNQKTDNAVSGGFSFSDFVAEIDAGRPVMLNLEGHTIVAVGYDQAGNTVYLHNTWDNAVHAMTWGGAYAGRAMYAVSIVNLESAETDVTEALPAIITVILDE